MDRDSKIVLINPLGAALGHYSESLKQLLEDCGAMVVLVTLMEPSAPGQTRLRWIWEYAKALRRQTARGSRRSVPITVIQTWPLLGYWDYLLLKLVLGNTPAFVILHDPRPLVRAVGYGPLARYLAGLRALGAKAIVHSKAALDTVREETNLHVIAELPHPMFPPTQPIRHSGETVIRVLGQYKPDRDIASMEALAADGRPGWRYEVVGRGWPTIPGWEVTSRFVSEAEFDHYIRTSSALVIPYVRFFQSGVAIRALEVGTPVVGLCSSSLAEVLGPTCRWLVEDGSWIDAVEAAIGCEPSEIHKISRAIYDAVLEQWRSWCQWPLAEESCREPATS